MSGPNSASADDRPANQPDKGLIYDGSVYGDLTNGCLGLLRLLDGGQCTHGPDAVGDAGGPTPMDAVTLAYGSIDQDLTADASGVPGTSGKRVQVIYAHASDVPDGYSSNIAAIRSDAVGADAVYNASAWESGSTRKIRYVVNADGSLNVISLQLTSTGDDNFNNTVRDLVAAGYTNPNRAYLVYMDANILCGQGSIDSDDSSGQSNVNATTVSYSRVDKGKGCWDGGASAAHELTHNFGGVQHTAPHSTYRQVPSSSNTWHCSDGHDVMCYSDAPGVTVTYTACPNKSPSALRLDCGKDDYFNTKPTAPSYLATHWDVANSPWLNRPSNRAWHLSDSVGPAYPSRFLTYGVSTDKPVRGNWDGAGGDGIGVFRAGSWYLDNNLDGATDLGPLSYAVSGDLPIAGDWDGDGVDSIGVWRPSNRTFYLRNANSTGGTNITFPYGLAGDVPVAGHIVTLCTPETLLIGCKEHDAVGLYRPSTGNWYFDTDFNGATNVTFAWGGVTDVPVMGDWNNDKLDTPGLVNAQRWTLSDHPFASTDYQFNYGQAGDAALAGRWSGTGGDTVGRALVS